MKLLLEDDLRSALGEENESSGVARYHRAHRLSDRVERVDLVDAFFRHLLAMSLVVLTEVQHEPEQGTLRLVADLPRQIAFVLRRLKCQRHHIEILPHVESFVRKTVQVVNN